MIATGIGGYVAGVFEQPPAWIEAGVPILAYVVFVAVNALGSKTSLGLLLLITGVSVAVLVVWAASMVPHVDTSRLLDIEPGPGGSSWLPFGVGGVVAALPAAGWFYLAIEGVPLGSRLNFNGDFQLDMDDEFFTQDLAGQGLAFPPLVTGDAKLSFRLPKRIMLGVAYDISDRLRVDGNFAYVFWSDLDAFVITLDSPDLAQPAIGLPARTEVALRRDWKGTVHAELSLRATVGAHERVRLSGTVGYHSGASPDATVDVASPDGHRLLGALGVAVQINERIAFLADGEVQGILPRTVTTSDHDLGNGTYEMILGGVHLHLIVKFGKGGKVVEAKTNAAPEPAAAE